MTPSPDDWGRAAGAVLARYPFALRGGACALGNRGGFSGARLWRVQGAAGPLCLRAWPGHESRQRLDFRHRLMARARDSGLTFVPAVFRTTGGDTAVEYANRLWEVAEWLPGRADYRAAPSPSRLVAGCQALARLHRAWEPVRPPDPAPCPALLRRLEAAREWGERIGSGWRPAPGLPSRGEEADRLAETVGRAWAVLVRQLGRVPQLLRPWSARAVRMQPCLCDVWHDHLLFEGERLTGLVDYGAVKVDGVAADLARLLGSLVGDDSRGWQIGLAAYREVRPLAEWEAELARALDETGLILGLASWLGWLFVEGRVFEDRAAVASRLGELVERAEGWG
jgi:homoserine kinase type II